MKRLIPAVALAGMFVGTAHAETSVTLYGIADVSVRYLSTGNDNGNSRVSMENGAISNSRWGLRGVEDLGDGMKAFFRLESGFNVQNGERSDPDSFFNRHAYVGLDGGEIGAISLGRQDTPLFTILADSYDPLTVGNYAQNSWLPVAMSRAQLQLGALSQRQAGRFRHDPVVCVQRQLRGPQAGRTVWRHAVLYDRPVLDRRRLHADALGQQLRLPAAGLEPQRLVQVRDRQGVSGTSMAAMRPVSSMP